MTPWTVCGNLQAKILEWVACPFSGDLPNPRIEPRPLALQSDSLPAEPQGKPKNTGMVSLSLLQGIFRTSAWSLLKLISIEYIRPSNYLILRHSFSFCLQSFPASGYFLMSQLYLWGDKSIGTSASVLPMNIQSWFPLGLADLISLQSKRLSGVSSTIPKHQFFSTQPSLRSNSHIHTWLPGKNHSFDSMDQYKL